MEVGLLATSCGSMLDDCAEEDDGVAPNACDVQGVDTCSGPCGAGVTSGCDRARAAFVACMNHGPLLHVLAQASEEADAAYSSKKPPKGKPWPRDHYLREIK